MNETLDRPAEVADEIVEGPAGALALAGLRASSLAPLTAVEAGLADLRAKYAATDDYDISTAFGMKVATTRRHAIRLVRYQVPKIVKARRAELNDIRDAVAAEGDRIIAALQAIEDPHDKLIQAEEARKAAEKAEADRIAAEKRAEAERLERERQERHEAGIAKIRSYLTRCSEPGMTAERISLGMAMLDRMTFGDEWQEFQGPAHDAKHETLVAMRELRAAALAREEEAARVEAERIERERVAAELAEQILRVRAENEALRQRAAALQAERDAAMALQDATPPSPQEAVELAELERERIADLEAGAPKPGDDAPLDELNTVPAAALVATPEGDRGPAPAAMLNLSEINRRLGVVSVTGATLAGFGIQPAQKIKASIMYPADAWPRLCDALIAHIQQVRGTA